ncbi:MAG TPA: helix-turn-helix transcriptional regulator [Chitinophagaceae bacterium]
MKKNKKNKKAENYSSHLLESMLNLITPEEQTNIDRKMMLAAKIYDGMKAKGWNQVKFAEEMGKQPSEISKWLSGTHTFTSDTLWAIGDKLDIELLPVRQVQKMIEVKYIPIVVKAEISEEEPEAMAGIFEDATSSQQKGTFFIRQYSHKMKIVPTRLSDKHANC